MLLSPPRQGGCCGVAPQPVLGLAETGEKYLAGGRMFLSGIRCGKASFFHHYMLLPVLEEEGVAYFNGHKVKWEIRHIWGQFKPCVRRSLASRLSPTQPDGAKPCDVTLASLPWWRRTNWSRVTQVTAGSWWLSHPGAGKMALPFLRLDVAVSSSSIQACPCGFGFSSPDVWLWLAAPVCTRGFKKWKKAGGCRAKNGRDAASDHTCASLAGKANWGRHSLVGCRAGGQRRPPPAPQEVGVGGAEG